MSNRSARRNFYTRPLDVITPGSRILVVDDDEAMRSLHSSILTRQGYEVEIAEDGADALEKLAGGRFDLVLTDRQMPVLDGESMVLALRSAGIRIPIVMVSGSLVEFPLSVSVACEVSAALPKPIRLTEVVAAVFSALHPFQPGLRVAT